MPLMILFYSNDALIVYKEEINYFIDFKQDTEGQIILFPLLL